MDQLPNEIEGLYIPAYPPWMIALIAAAIVIMVALVVVGVRNWSKRVKRKAELSNAPETLEQYMQRVQRMIAQREEPRAIAAHSSECMRRIAEMHGLNRATALTTYELRQNKARLRLPSYDQEKLLHVLDLSDRVLFADASLPYQSFQEALSELSKYAVPAMPEESKGV